MKGPGRNGDLAKQQQTNIRRIPDTVETSSRSQPGNSGTWATASGEGDRRERAGIHHPPLPDAMRRRWQSCQVRHLGAVVNIPFLRTAHQPSELPAF